MKKLPTSEKLTVGHYSRYTVAEGKKLERIAKKNKCSVATLIKDAVKAVHGI